MKYDSLFLSGYKIVFDPSELYKENGITPEIRKLLETVLKQVLLKKKNAEADIIELIDKYPEIPQFKNYLSTYYSLVGRFDMAYEVNQQIIRKHPDYLFGKINLVNEYLRKKEFDKVPAVLGEAMEIKSLYPDREVFHVEEVLSFYNVAVEYFVETGNIEAAEMRLKIMSELDKDNVKIKEAEKVITISNIKAGYARFKETMAKRSHSKFIPKIKYKQTDVAPSFINHEMTLLYKFSFQIDFKEIKKILELPKESLIEDLKKVVIDSIIRFKHFKKIAWSPSTHSFPLHALFMLRELKAEEGLDVVLEVLRQNEKFLDYWFSDALTENIWTILYKCGKNNLEVLMDFILEEGNDTYARASVSQAVSQIAINIPERRKEIIEWYFSVFNFFIEEKDNDMLVDTTLIGLMVCDVLDLNVVELEETFVKLYLSEIIDIEIVGELDELLKDLHSKDHKVYRDKCYSLEDIYKQFARFEKSEEKYSEIKKLKAVNDARSKEYPPLTDIYRKVGRNEKCPCGSGLKFKKCHGKGS